MHAAVITIGISPKIDLGPFSLAWHGLTIAIGIMIGGLLAGREARRRGLSPDPIFTMGIVLMVGALVGSRIFYLAEHGGLTDPGRWLGSYGFTFYGGFIAVALALGVYIWRTRVSLVYLDLVALALPLGYAIGRIGDIIYGEHYGPESTFFLAVRNSNPGADVPSHALAYHNGGLYESLIGLAVFAVVWPLRKRLTRPISAVWLVLALLSTGRFVEFFVRSDSAKGALGLETAQWTSLILIAVAALGAWVTSKRVPRSVPDRGRRSIFATKR